MEKYRLLLRAFQNLAEKSTAKPGDTIRSCPLLNEALRSRARARGCDHPTRSRRRWLQWAKSTFPNFQ
jgi:hypothetical protein